MAAGLGFKTFTTGEVLSATDVNGYLMQGILVFASAAARDAAITAPAEGQFAYLKDTNVTTYYTGSAWANVDTTGMTNPMTTTGDMIYSSSGSTPARLGIGSTGQVLTVAGGVPTWAAGGSPATTLTLINTGGTTPSGSTTTISSLSGYNRLMIVLSGIKINSDPAQFSMRVNADTNNKYSEHISDHVNSASYDANVHTILQTGLNGTSSLNLGYINAAADVMSGIITIEAANSTTDKIITRIVGVTGNTSGNRRKYGASIYTGTSVISSVSFITSAGSWSAGTIYVYGSN